MRALKLARWGRAVTGLLVTSFIGVARALYLARKGGGVTTGWGDVATACLQGEGATSCLQGKGATSGLHGDGEGSGTGVEGGKGREGEIVTTEVIWRTWRKILDKIR